MLMTRKLSTAFLWLILFAATAAADEAPAWLRQAATLNPPANPGKDTHAVALLNEERRVVEEDGRVTVTTTYAVRILAREGRRRAIARVVFNTDSEKVKDLNAWLIRPDGMVKSYGKKQTMEVALAQNDIYSEAKIRVIAADDDADAGCVFGYESVTEERSVFSQFRWYFQDAIPTLASRFTVTLPQNWRAEGVMFNYAKLEPSVNGTTYTWELKNLPRIEDEPASPEAASLVPRLAVSIYPAAGKAAALRTFTSWKDVSRYLTELNEPQASYNEAMAAKARELTAQAKTEYERIQAIGRYAQAVNYISVQIGTGRGGGYRPHAALDVFTKNYGDCKDKATLMRALLKSLNIEAYPVVIYSGDPHHVRAEWPSPHQFNHCIIGVKVSDATNTPTVIKHPSLGRLLIFDPTDEHTPVGDLPDHEQGCWALVVAGEAGELLRMPATPPEANQLERTIEAALDAEGAPRPEYNKRIERWITRGAPGAAVAKIEPADDDRAGRFVLGVEFSAPGYAKTMRGKLMVFKPAIIARRESLFLTEEKRQYPVVLDADAFAETVRIKLPEGFEVDELPESLELNHPFGNYAMTCEAKDGHLVFKRTLVLRAGTIPVEQYPAVRNFFARVLGAEQAPVVLAKK
jgi:hypothetical protein